MKNPELLHTASEQFLGKKEHEIKSTVLQTLEGHLRCVNISWCITETKGIKLQTPSLTKNLFFWAEILTIFSGLSLEH